MNGQQLRLIVVLLDRGLRANVHQADLRLYLHTDACLHFTDHNFWDQLRCVRESSDCYTPIAMC